MPHYRPDAETFLYTGEDTGALSEAVNAAAADALSKGRKAGVIDFKGDAGEAARSFFRELRGYDSLGVDVIFVAGVREEGLGLAVMDRMRKAAGGKVINI